LFHFFAVGKLMLCKLYVLTKMLGCAGTDLLVLQGVECLPNIVSLGQIMKNVRNGYRLIFQKNSRN